MEKKTLGAATQQKAELEGNPRHDNKVIMIALLGVTGAGKSTFVNTAAGSNKMKISHGSQPCEQLVPDVSTRSTGGFADVNINGI